LTKPLNLKRQTLKMPTVPFVDPKPFKKDIKHFEIFAKRMDPLNERMLKAALRHALSECIYCMRMRFREITLVG